MIANRRSVYLWSTGTPIMFHASTRYWYDMGTHPVRQNKYPVRHIHIGLVFLFGHGAMGMGWVL